MIADSAGVRHDCFRPPLQPSESAPLQRNFGPLLTFTNRKNDAINSEGWGPAKSQMTGNTKNVLGDDLPKVNPWQDDRLGYAPFAKRIARVIISLAAPNGYVIGIHGQWGSGKSTMLNFILAHLDKHNIEHEDDEVVYIDFRPWIVSGHQDLIVAFFKVLSEKLGPRESRWGRFWKRTAGFLSGTTDNLVDAAATVALSVDPSGVAAGLAGNLAKKSVNAMLGRFLEDPSLQAAYDSLRVQLGRSGKRFIVTIDDIDRLEDRDVRSIMQMVKSIGRLPNVVYLLSYDRDIVWETLDQGTNRPGPRFAEKIVQQEIELPKPSKNALLAILDQEISFLTANAPESARWQFLVRDGIHRWIRSPRDVVRLANAVKFLWPALEREIDPQDLLVMEGLRLFDTGAFNWIRDNRDFLFTEGRFFMANDNIKEEAVDVLKRNIPKEIQSQVMRVLSVLFPQSVEWFEARKGHEEEAFIEVTKRRGIGSEAGYDSYFGMHPSADAIPRALINDLMSRLDDADGIEHVIRSYMGKRNRRGELMVAKLLDELRVQFRGSRPAEPTGALLDALFRVGEQIIGIEWDGDMFQLSPRAQIGFLIRNMLEQWGPENAGAHLLEAFESATSAAFMANIYVARGRELLIFPSDSSERPVISTEDFERLGVILADKIERAIADGSLPEAPYYFDIIRAWGHVRGPEVAKSWLADGIAKSAEFMVKAGRGLVTYSIGTKERHYTMREAPESVFYDLQLLVDAGAKHLAHADLTHDQRKLLIAIVSGSKRLQQGLSPEDFWDDDV